MAGGSIPAGAGKPLAESVKQAARMVYPRGCGEPVQAVPEVAGCWVYPRGCGGASMNDAMGTTCGGLSPRVRGSHQETG